LSSNPDLSLRLTSDDFKVELSNLLSRYHFDVLQIEGLEMSLYWKAIAGNGNEVRPSVSAVVYDEHNAEYVLQRRAFEIDRTKPLRWHAAFYSLIQWRKLVRFEASVCRVVDAVLTVSETDASALRAIASPPRLTVVPNGVDVDYFEWVFERASRPALVFTGTMDFRPNIDAVSWFCEDILPHVRKDIPEISFYIVGRSPSHAVLQLGKLPGVVVTGLVEDVRPFFRKASVFVVPMRFGGGTRLKVLEAMASGLPVVSTTLGVEGIESEPGQHLIVADEPASFAKWVVQLLGDRTMRRRIAENARDVVEREYDWRTITPNLEALYSQIV
jgi:glycosyltransferase involved in cell wall biosynthesis